MNQEDIIEIGKEVNLLNEKNQKITGDKISEFLNKNREISVKQELKVGDIVRLKYFTEDFVVTQIRDDAFKYCGCVAGKEEYNTLFNQWDISAIIKFSDIPKVK